jgi:hypothetical protein
MDSSDDDVKVGTYGFDSYITSRYIRMWKHKNHAKVVQNVRKRSYMTMCVPCDYMP